MAKKQKTTPATLGDRPIAVNRKATFDYEILETVEAGMVLTGTEIKSLREGRINLRDSYAQGERGEVWLHKCHIAPYSAGNRYNHDPTRPRKLLLHKKQILELTRQVETGGLTLVPLRVYFKRHRAKVLLGLARGRRQYDKRHLLGERDAQREVRRALAERGRG